jgi:murein DD-endopeptidase MepM/ murein hydrolase activator NlpD
VIHPAAAVRRAWRSRLGLGVGGILTVVLVLGWSTTRHVAAPTSAQTQRQLTQVALPQDLLASASPSPGQPTTRRPPVVGAPKVKALKQRVDPDVFVRTTKPVTESQVAALLARTGGRATLVATGGVALGKGSTTAIGVDPSSFRSIAPKGTAESTPLWQSVARGDMAVAHTVAKALAVALGQDTPVAAQAQQPWDFRVGAYATTGLPGVGVVIDQAYDDLLGLTPRTGLVISAAGQDPVVTAALAQEVLGQDVQATPLRIMTGPGGRLTWVAPAAGPVTSGYGYRSNPFGGSTQDFHAGIDIGAPFGSPIYAASAGVVTYAGPAEGYGNEVIVTHAGGVQTVYGHMERILVTPGQPVRGGQPIALVGSEGESTGAHLHFEVHLQDSTIDPLPWLESHGVKTVR